MRVVYEEPDEWGHRVRVAVPVAVAVERQRAKGHYDSEQEALLDFIAENWAWVEEE